MKKPFQSRVSQNLSLKKSQNVNSESIEIASQNDYEYLVRSTEVSLKNYFTLLNKPIKQLNPKYDMDSMKNIPIVCSYADMEFKTSTTVHQQWIRLMNIPKINFGYTRFDEYTKNILLQRLQNNVYLGCNSENLLLVFSMLSYYHLVITQLTTMQDQILIFTPTYYRFLFTLNVQKRKIIEYQLETKQNQDGLLDFFIDFQKLQKLFQSNKIKMLVFVNPHNPTGRIWKHQQMQNLARLVKKYECLVFSDDIFLECAYEPKVEYTSFLKFEDIHQNLIWAGSFGKAFNCSGNSFTYSIVPNKQIRSKLDFGILKLAIFPNMCSVKMLESCFTVGQDWRKNTILYIRQNHKILNDEIKKRGLKLGVFKMQSGFLAVIDFKNYGWTHSEIKALFDSQNIFPTYLDNCYVNQEKETISVVRMNLAMNKQLLMELIDRMQKMIKYSHSQ